MPALKNGKIIKTFILKYVLAVNSQRTCYDFLQFFISLSGGMSRYGCCFFSQVETLLGARGESLPDVFY